ncbi:MAG: hypothetical protein COT84_04730 [Chlamydiae bacterium CG10_big_fil_rev_8_21_14_0_10_35_9]|nr:MAG: hypothetical protein COT84_04730 [Chlamydiae bacterium CG10_big_fil_rev_8_21_14_0_10_35_9]
MEKLKMRKAIFKAFTGVAALLLTANAHAQSNDRMKNDQCDPCYDQGHAIKPCQMMAAYNAPARIDVRCSWDIYAAGTFIYWYASQEDMAMAISDNSAAALPIVNGKVIYPDFGYEPGFKALLGINMSHDDWDGFVEYTWLHFTRRTSTTSPAGGILLPTRAHPNNVTSATAASSRWKLSLDTVNAALARSYYVGTHLTFRTHFGARLALIDQRYRLHYTPVENPTTQTTERNKSDSWALGPRAGLDSNWILGLGFRVFGNVAADLLYSRYKVTTTETDATDPNITLIDIKEKIRVLRPHAEYQMGLGWGTYFDNNNWHVDIAASYDFHVFWNQNVFRTFFDDVSQGVSATNNGDLFLHGLTATVRFDF